MGAGPRGEGGGAGERKQLPMHSCKLKLYQSYMYLPVHRTPGGSIRATTFWLKGDLAKKRLQVFTLITKKKPGSGLGNTKFSFELKLKNLVLNVRNNRMLLSVTNAMWAAEISGKDQKPQAYSSFTLQPKLTRMTERFGPVHPNYFFHTNCKRSWLVIIHFTS